jgi:hypothetical protein
MDVFEFDAQAKIRRLDVYIQGIVEASARDVAKR